MVATKTRSSIHLIGSIMFAYLLFVVLLVILLCSSGTTSSRVVRLRSRAVDAHTATKAFHDHLQSIASASSSSSSSSSSHPTVALSAIHESSVHGASTVSRIRFPHAFSSDSNAAVHQPWDVPLWLVHLKSNRWSDKSASVIRNTLHPFGLGEYVPHDGWLVSAPVAKMQELVELHAREGNTAGINFITHVEPAWKQLGTVGLERSTCVCSCEPDVRAHYEVRAHLANWRQLCEIPIIASTCNSLAGDLAEAWQFALLESLGEHAACVKLDARRLEYMAVLVLQDCSCVAEEVAAVLAARNEVSFVRTTRVSPKHASPRRAVSKQNKFAHDVVQSEEIGKPLLWNLGYLGEGELISVADTGVDYDGCFFHDENRPMPMNRVDHSHRKIVSYVTDVDFSGERMPGGDEDVHGTHIAGTLAGLPLTGTEIDEWKGMAPDSKLAVFDYMGPDDDTVYVPTDIVGEYFNQSYSIGARLSSNSWGDESGEYDSFARDIDAFLYDFPESTVFFAAGNYGEKGVYSLSTPGVCKNVITVGSCYNAVESLVERGLAEGIRVNSSADGKLNGDVYPVKQASYGAAFYGMNQGKLSRGIPLLYAHNGLCNGTWDATESMSGAAVMTVRGNCSFADKSKNAELYGAMLLVVVNSEGGPVPDIGGHFVNVSIPTVIVSQALGGHLIARLPVTLDFPVSHVELLDNEHSMSDFSSRGPTVDGRLKPDIIAPGESITSAKSDHDVDSFNCPAKVKQLLTIAGTSMATPVAAGHGALVREYVRKQHKLKNPTSSLIKALLIAASVSVSNEVANVDNAKRTPVEMAPSIFQGFGRLKLSTVINEQSKHELFLVDDRHGVNGATADTHCFRVSSDGLLVAVLAWIDPPASPAAELQSVNDLNLVVTVDGEFRPLVGNAYGRNTAAAHALHSGAGHDELNNVEKVVLNVSAGAHVAIRVVGHAIRGPSLNQPYSLVVHGNLTQEAPHKCAFLDCPSGCGDTSGYCTALGTCQCDAGFVGLACEHAVELLMPGEISTSFALRPFQWKLFRFWHRTGDNGANVIMRSSVQQGVKEGDPDIYVLGPDSEGWMPVAPQTPSLHEYDFANLDCEYCGHSRDSVIVLPDESAAGVYTVGVFGVCCDASNVTVEYKVIGQDFEGYPEDVADVWTQVRAINQARSLPFIGAPAAVNVRPVFTDEDSTNIGARSAKQGDVLRCSYDFELPANSGDWLNDRPTLKDHAATESGTRVRWYARFGFRANTGGHRDVLLADAVTRTYVVDLADWTRGIDRVWLWCDVAATNSFGGVFGDIATDKARDTLGVAAALATPIYVSVLRMSETRVLCDFLLSDDTRASEALVTWEMDDLPTNVTGRVLDLDEVDAQLGSRLSCKVALDRNSETSGVFTLSEGESVLSLPPRFEASVQITDGQFSCDYEAPSPDARVGWLINWEVVENVAGAILPQDVLIRIAQGDRVACFVVSTNEGFRGSRSADFLVTASDAQEAYAQLQPTDTHVSVFHNESNEFVAVNNTSVLRVRAGSLLRCALNATERNVVDDPTALNFRWLHRDSAAQSWEYVLGARARVMLVTPFHTRPLIACEAAACVPGKGCLSHIRSAAVQIDNRDAVQATLMPVENGTHASNETNTNRTEPEYVLVASENNWVVLSVGLVCFMLVSCAIFCCPRIVPCIATADNKAQQRDGDLELVRAVDSMSAGHTAVMFHDAVDNANDDVQTEASDTESSDDQPLVLEI